MKSRGIGRSSSRLESRRSTASQHSGDASSQLITFNSIKLLLTGTLLSDYKIYRVAGLQLAERTVGAGRHAPEQGCLEKEISHICGAGDGVRGR